MSQPWSNGLFSCGDIGGCLYSWYCGPCAVASVRQNYDNSNWCFNFCCLSAVAVHNIVREGYGIEGSCMTDICTVMWCTPCAINRLRQEVQARGPSPNAMRK